MDSVEQTIVLGFNSAKSIPMAYAKEGDNNRTIHFEFINELSSYSVQDTTYIFFREQFSDKSILAPEMLDKSRLSEDGTEFDMTLSKYMTTISGVAKCELVFVNSETTPEFDIHGEVISDDCVILSTQTFHLYIAPITYDDCRADTADSVRVNELLQLVLASKDAAAIDKIVQENEEVRIQEELKRVNAENTRIEAEGSRIQAESNRDNAETAREQAEQLRDSAEQARINAETLRGQAESVRSQAEQDRVNAENLRDQAESLRKQSEQNRIDAENLREQAEQIRVSSENTRDLQEQARISAENTRVSSENTRIANEDIRENNETVRKQNEVLRVTNETERSRAEQERIAREGSGDHSSHSPISYVDEDGNTHTIDYKDSRVGVGEKLKAIAEGGTYIDSAGNTYTLLNEYENMSGDVVPVDSSMLNSMSVLAIGVMAKEMAEAAKGSVDSAIQAAANAAISEANAANSATEAQNSATDAQASADDAAESARQAEASVLSGGYCSMEIDENGNLILARTSGLEDRLTFRIVDNEYLEVEIYG